MNSAGIKFGLLVTFIILKTALPDSDMRFDHLTIENGLSQNTINAIYQDSQGFMWFGTQEGLNKFDGYKFTVFKHEPLNPNSLSHSWIWDIFQDSRKNLWIATWSGLNKFDPLQNEFTRYLPDSDSLHAISGTRPTSVCEDDYGFIWIGTWGGGLNRYDYSTDRFRNFQNDPNGTPESFIRKIYKASGGSIWVGSWDGLLKIEIDKTGEYHFVRYKKDPANKHSISSNKITSIFEDKSGTLWIGTFGGGLNRYDAAMGRFQQYRHSPTQITSLSSDDINTIFEDRHGQLWVGTVSQGLNLFDAAKGNFIRYVHDPDDAGSLNGNNVYSIYEDASGMLWIGANGLNIQNRQAKKFRHFSHDPENPNSLSYNRVTSFWEDKYGSIWIGTEGGGINRFERKENRFISYQKDIQNANSLSHNNVSSIVGDSEGFIWVGTRGGGVNKLNPASGEFTCYQENPEIPETEGLNYVNALTIDNSGTLWIATYDKGLIRFDIRQNEYRHFRSDPRDEKTLSGDYLLRVLWDSTGDIWLGSWGGGLTRYIPSHDIFSRFQHRPEDMTTLGDNIVHTIYETVNESGRMLWVGTSNGLSYMNPDNFEPLGFGHIFEKDGLPSSVVYGILEDDHGNLWLSTNQGICKFDPRTGSFHNYTSKDGLQSNEFNAGAFLKTGNGELLFGGIKGFNLFHPDSIVESDFMPEVVITAFSIFDKPVHPKSYSAKSKTLRLAHKENFFSFEFASLDFNQPDRNQYAYMMEGLDAKWIFSGNRRYASYTNLDPGEYTFRVKGTNSDGVWNDNHRSLKIVITPPYWKTWWFRIFVILFITAGIYTAYKLRVSKLLEIERLRVRIASDLHDDIGSALTRVAIYSEIIQTNPDSSKSLQFSRKIGMLSREIINTMGDIVWSIDARNDSFKNLLDRARDFALNVLNARDIKVNFTTSGINSERKIPVEYRQNMFLIFKEAITNIAKHAQATQVEISFKNIGGSFTCLIRDNGIGFDTAGEFSGNGLKNMRLRAERIGAKLDFSNDNGTELSLTVNKL